MKLLSKTEVESSKQKQNEDILERNSRLAEYLKGGLKKFNLIKDNYDQDKLKRSKEYESFCQKINAKKSELLKDYTKWEKAVKDQKDLYYSIVEKMDEIQEREEKVKLGEVRLKDRESFNLENEARMKAKLDILIKK
jgi:hypothetical protein